MKESIKKGLSFGATSAIITTLGIMVGTHSATDLKHAIIAAILVVALADSLADSMGVYFSECSRKDTARQEAIVSLVFTFLSKLLLALTFLLPIIFIKNLHSAIIICIVYGIIMLAGYSFFVAKSRQENALSSIVWYVTLAIAVIGISHYVGGWINNIFG